MLTKEPLSFLNLYKTSFEMVDFGKASAIAWTMVFVSVILSAIQFKFGGIHK
ncbi:hypothetical protein EfmGK961_06780 [Enterococcus faecium]|nr:hypothetical protein EfmGK961_06780 [Enterococcus faecium]